MKLAVKARHRGRVWGLRRTVRPQRVGIRTELVERARERIAAGHYDREECLAAVAETLARVLRR